MNKKYTLAFAMLFAFLRASSLPAYAGSISACGDLDIENEVYTLTQGVSSSGTCFSILANNITLDGQGYTATYSQASGGYGVSNSGGYDNITIKNLNVAHGGALGVNSYAIYASGMAFSKILNNTVTTPVLGEADDNHAIALYSSDNNTVQGNTLSTHGGFDIGVVLSSSNSNTIRNNTVNTDYGVGMSLSASSANNLSGNYIRTRAEWSSYSGIHGISISGSSNSNTIENNDIASPSYDSSNIYVTSSSYNMISGNKITIIGDDTFTYGIYMGSSTYNIVFNNTISLIDSGSSMSDRGIVLEGASNNTISTNNISTSGDDQYKYGIWLNAASNSNNIFNNNITTASSSSHGIYGSGVATNNITNNRITTSGGDSHGVYLYSSSNSNIVANNTIYAGSSGGPVYVRLASSSNIISGNILNSPSFYPLVIQGASNSNVVSNNTISGSYRIYIASESGAHPTYNTIINNTIAATGSLGALNVYRSSAGNSYTTISGNTITSCGVDGCIYLQNANSNIISDNNLTDSTYNGGGIYFSASSSNNITNNRIIVSGGGTSHGFLYGSQSSTFINNTVLVTSSSAGAYALLVSPNNKIMGGSIEITSGYYTYYLGSSTTTSSVVNTNWTAARSIYFADTISQFNYNNETDGKIWLNTSVLSAGSITRTLSKWKNSTMKWNDSASLTASYLLSGLLPDATYIIDNKTGTTRTVAYTRATNSNGDLSAFTIALNGNTEIRAYPATPINVTTNATTYRLNSTAMITATIDRAEIGLTSPISGALDIYIVSFNGSRFEAEINDSGTWTTGSISLANVITRTIVARWNTSQHDDGTYTVYAEFNYTDDGEDQLQTTGSSTFMLNPLRVRNSAIDAIFSKAGIANITYGGSSMLGNGTYLLTSSTPVIGLYPTIAIITYPEGVYLKVYSNLSKIMVYSNHSFNPVLYLRPDFTNFYNGTANTFSGSGQQFNSIQNMTDVYSASNGVAVIGRNLNVSVYNTSYKEIRLYNVTDFEIYLHSGDYTSAINERNIYLNPAPVIFGVPQELRGVSWERFQAMSALSQDALKAGMDISGVGFQVLFNETENYADIPDDRGVLIVKHPVSVLDRFGGVERTYLGVAVWKTI